jgi:large repetitive protein
MLLSWSYKLVIRLMKFMNVQIKRIILLSWIFWLSVQAVFSQSHVSRNNYTGAWETSSSWSPSWAVPQTNNLGSGITINGYITVNSSVSFSILPCNFIINDTLVINGDLTLGLLTNLTINGNGILIVRGNLTLGEFSTIITNNYIVVTGNLLKVISPNNGSFISNNNPEKVFIGGNISPTGITNHKSNFPALNCSTLTSIQYPNSNCSYGNLTDIINDPIYPFFQSTCTIAPPTITAGGPTTFCAGGSVTLTSSSGTSYLWSNGATSRSINVTSSGSYTVKVANSGGCQSTSAPTIVTVNALPATPTITASGPTTFCTGGNVTLTSSPGTSYLWSNGANTSSITVTAAGGYTVRVTNGSGCQSIASVATIITVNSLPSTPTITASGPRTFCSGGSVTLTSSAGSTYLWSSGETSQAINVTSSGSYTVRVTNSNGCQSASSAVAVVTVNALPGIPTITASGPTSFCVGGSVNLTSSAGTSYLWSNGATTSSINVTGSGSYMVQVKNASGCQSLASLATTVTVNALPITPTITASGPTNFCFGGNVTLTSSAGTSYLWSNGETTQSINVTNSGNYTVKVINANGCQSTASVATVVTVNALPVIPTITAGGPTTFCIGGSVTLTSTAGTTYLWSNGATTRSINVSTSGSYTVQVTNASGCQSAVSAATMINVNALPIVNAGTDMTIPNGTSTTINATVTGTGPFTYSWTPSAQLTDASIEDPTTVNLSATTVFTLTATSLTTTCSNTDAVKVTISGVPLNSTPTATPLTVCAGAGVQLHALAIGGSGFYSYTWTSTPVGFTSSIADPTAYPLVSTTYRVAVSDGFNSVNRQVAVTVNALPVTPVITAGGPTTFCAGGSVTLTSSLGTSYLWSNGATTQSINVTSAGSYTVQVTNASGCQSAPSAARVVTVNSVPVTPTISAGGQTTFCDGASVTLTSSAGTSYLWSNGATTQSINVTTSGSYTVKVINASGCQSAASVANVVTVNASPVTPTITADGPTTFCANDSVTLTSSAETSYLWSDGETTQSINVNTTGTYTIKVTNTNGCQSATSAATAVTVNSLPGTPAITADGPTTFCDGGNVTLTASAGTSYLWSNGSVSPSINITKSGSYTVQVTTPYGCQSAPSSATVIAVNALPPTPTIFSSGPTTFCNGGNVTLTSSAEASYLWSNSATSSSINVTTAGNYFVQVTNASGCQSASSVATIVTVNASPDAPTITAEGPTSFCEGDTSTLTSSAGIRYLWSGGETSPSIVVSKTGSYTVKVFNESGCLSAASDPVTVTVNTLPVISLGSNGPVCAGNSLTLTSSPAGMIVYYWSGPGEFTSLLQNPSVTDSATFDMTGIYSLIVANNNGCTNTATENIIINAAPIADAGPDQELNFRFETQMNSVLSASETGEWSLISGSGSISDIHSPTTRVSELSIGQNKFLWKVLNGNCEDTAEVKINVFDLVIPSVITPNGDNKNDYFKIGEYMGRVELIIINRWGNEEYTNKNYLNNWDGRNNKGSELSADTYFYVLKFDNGRIKKGSVLIKR